MLPLIDCYSIYFCFMQKLIVVVVFISVCDNIISTLIFPFAKVGARHMRGYPPPGDPGRGGIGAALGTRGSSPLPGQTRQATLPAF